MFNLVFGGTKNSEKQTKAYAKVLSNFDPHKVLLRYSDNPERLLRDLVNARGLEPRQAKRQLTEQRAQFRTFANGILAGAAYLSAFVDGNAFAKFVRGWTDDPDKVAMLPEHLAKEGIPGFGPAIAADFLKASK